MYDSEITRNLYNSDTIRNMMPSRYVDDKDQECFEWINDRIKKEAIYCHQYELNIHVETFGDESFIDCPKSRKISSGWGQPTLFLTRLTKIFTDLGFKVTCDLDKLTISWKE